MKHYLKNPVFKLSVLALAGVLAFSLLLPSYAWAYRSNAGGGEAGEFDVGEFALGTALGVASSMAGSAISSGIKTGFDTGSFSFSGFGLNNMGNLFDSFSNSYTSSFATGQVSRAMGTMGQYYNIDAPITTGLSTFASSAAIGAINQNWGSLAEGAVKGGILYTVADDKGQYDPWVGYATGLAGDIAGGLTDAGIAGASTEKIFKTGVSNAIQSIPSGVISVYGSELTEGRSIMDKYIINQSLSGAYSVAGSLGSGVVSKIGNLKPSYTIGTGGVREYSNSSGSGITSSGTSVFLPPVLPSDIEAPDPGPGIIDEIPRTLKVNKKGEAVWVKE